MILSSLLETYSSAVLICGESSYSLLGICKPEGLEDKHLCYIKDKKFLASALKSLSEAGEGISIGFVVETRIRDSFLEEIKDYQTFIAFVVEVPSIDEALCCFSKPFFFEKMSQFSATKNMVHSYRDQSQTCDIADDVFIGENVTLGENVTIHSGTRIMANVSVGDDTVIYPNTVIYPFSSIGKACRIHSQVTIGADGFGYNFINGQHLKIWHFGGVTIGDFVEIGSSTCIDSGSFQPTIIGSGSKIDNLVQIGHNVEIGEHVILCGQVGLGGSCKIDAYSALGGKAAVGPSSHIGMASQLAGGAMAVGTWPAKSRLAGYPAFEASKWLRSVSKFKKLGERK